MKARIAVLAGDGVGPEVTAEARKVLRRVAEKLGHEVEFTEALIGGAAIDATGSALPEATLEVCRDSDAILLGAVGGPKWDDPDAEVRPEQGLLGLRKALGLFANLRPVRVYPELAASSPLRRRTLEGVDLVIVRELTSGLYFGERGRRPDETGERAYDTMAYNTGEIERIVRRAAALAESRRGRLTLVDKANVLETSRLWRSTAQRVIEEEFPGVTLESILVDAAAMHLLQRPASFDVIVTENLFGDILSDEASVLAGSMGMLPSASLGESGPGLYEPIHGSAPDIAGRDLANPTGMILSAAMMCRESLGWGEAADLIEASVAEALRRGARTADIARAGDRVMRTAEMGDRVTEGLDWDFTTADRRSVCVSSYGIPVYLPVA